MSTIVSGVVDQAVKKAMDRGGIADITTIGRKTGQKRRIEIYFHQFDGDYYFTGRPGRKRDWEANIVAHPGFTLHLKRGLNADVAVIGEPEPDREKRAAVLFRALTESWNSPPERVKERLDHRVDNAPFIRFHPVEE